ncbi:MAG: 5-(carboxyamino)imidazole ribonucleotide synthase [Cyanobacteria bacterium M5B4]|nr:MAG: 5-(carboxyamino)imidazole ribonucleotide synthase [Cyanobacteria bacterium M5B4]
MTTVGVIGGGQLASMTAQAARSLGITVSILPDSSNDPGIQFASYVAQDIEDLVTRSDVITFENEFLDLSLLKTWERKGAKFLPNLNSLTCLLDKYEQRSFLLRHNLPTPEFSLIESYLSISQPVFPVVMKICRQGYDGKGTQFIYDMEQLTSSWQQLGKPPAIVESLIEFEQELAIMIARSVTGDISLFPVVETQQINQVCRCVIAPARISEQTKTTIETIVQEIVQKLNYIGILGVEFFLTKNDEVLVNEMAPRPHNSGHYTIEGCLTSQFDQLLRSILGLPLAPTTMTSPVAIMVNLLGLQITDSEYNDRLIQLKQLPQTYLHWYNKTPRPGRKLGHVTILTDNYNQGLDIATIVEKIWYLK